MFESHHTHDHERRIGNLERRLELVEMENKFMSAATDALRAAVEQLAASVQVLISLPREDTAAIQAQTDAVTVLRAQVDAAAGTVPPA